ncbi:YbjN domain-containing protein [Geomonas sp. Red69]|uniref:YbjN domain-containing protein n=1 Tax=Geomonas diazotrophica TaxID=2843197 RepID=A0ABX8JPE4_9BACT|nr:MULTISPECIES: YbjN domain-containing protein [Geomonas]MBU5636700.1 YbjN domain-containing protein [Geomonas diazotrophica]QWV98484.1 YbjN domain-containing protein [Geomonas nitrogeniifigens]QXE87667.1 YbjN domain-containing protein [Geomonas nitrogeniifigens]
MAQNASAFEQYLKGQEITLEKNTHEDNTLYVIRENIEEVGPVSLMALFNDSDRYVTLICYKYFAFPSEKKPAMLEMINTLNAEYTMVKYVEAGNALSIQVVVPFHDNFSSEVIVDMIALIFRAMKEEHPRILKALQ